MKKVIFEGFIDGVKFDNIKDYNEAVTKAIAEGKNVQASSNTKVVNTEDEDENKEETCECGCGCECKQCKCQKPNLTLPGFVYNEETNEYEETLYDDFAQLLNTDPDEYVSDSEFNEKLKVMNEMMDEIWDEIFSNPTEQNLAKCALVINDIHNILNEEAADVTDDMDDVDEYMEDLNDKLNQARREKSVVVRYMKILSEYHNFYKRMEEELTKRNFDIDKTPVTHTETTEREPQHEFDLNKIHSARPTAKLAEDIFTAKDLMEHPMMKLLAEMFK